MNSSQVIETYNLLLWMIDLRNLPEDYEPPALYNMLVMNLNNLNCPHIYKRCIAYNYTRTSNIIVVISTKIYLVSADNYVNY